MLPLLAHLGCVRHYSCTCYYLCMRAVDVVVYGVLLTLSACLYNNTDTMIQLWSVWGCFLGCICTSASGALGYDCLPSDENGRPLAASRDSNLLKYASSIPSTGLPLLLGGSMVAPHPPTFSHYRLTKFTECRYGSPITI